MDILVDLETGDFVLEQDDLVFVEGIDEVKQECVLRLRMWRGENFLDAEDGLIQRDWFRKGKSLAAIRDDVRKELLKVDGVLQVASPALEIDTLERVLTVTVEVVSSDGPFVLRTDL